LAGYAAKIVDNSDTFEAWHGHSLCGLVAAYLNDPQGRQGFVTSVSVDAEVVGAGIGTALLCNCIEAAREKCFESVSLEVSADNTAALRLYRKLGFVLSGQKDNQVVMKLELT
jgi:ribosomal protein S18 acetylase RimI-like enzyme